LALRGKRDAAAPIGRLQRFVQWVEAQRRQPIWFRILPPITLVLAVFVARVVADCHHPAGSFEFFLPALSLCAAIFGLWPGLAAAAAAYVLEVLWFVGLARGVAIYEATHWDHAIIAVLFGLVAVSATVVIEVMWWIMIGDAEEPGS
jgi:hypothetical protein